MTFGVLRDSYHGHAAMEPQLSVTDCWSCYVKSEALGSRVDHLTFPQTPGGQKAERYKFAHVSTQLPSQGNFYDHFSTPLLAYGKMKVRRLSDGCLLKQLWLTPTF